MFLVFILIRMPQSGLQANTDLSLLTWHTLCWTYPDRQSPLSSTQKNSPLAMSGLHANMTRQPVFYLLALFGQKPQRRLRVPPATLHVSHRQKPIVYPEQSAFAPLPGP